MKLFCVGTLILIAYASSAGAQQRVATDTRIPAVDQRVVQALFSRKISITLDRVPLAHAIDAVGTKAGIAISYRAEVLDATEKTVTARLHNMPLGDALAEMLSGTTLAPVPVSATKIAIVGSNSADYHAMVSQGPGTITGRVIDATTKQPIDGATVTIEGTRLAARSGSDGTFRITNVTPGTHRVTARRLGYQGQPSTVTLENAGQASVTIALTPAATPLTEVVTTAIGDRQRLEVGNVIARINVDSIAPTAPITSLTDLLTARAPGLQVIETNGLVGAGPALRIRGQSSMALQSDPIIIVDGVRQDNKAGSVQSAAHGYPVPSPSRINDLDVSQIATIDILKGPAATTVYGTDAANGVIVITTKRGQAGPPVWRMSAERGWSEIPTNFPDYYYGWGRTTDGTNQPVNCTLVPLPYGGRSLLDGTCTLDSLVHDNPLNNKATTIYGSGLRERVNLDVSGGSQMIRYYLGAATSRDLGTTRLPSVLKPLAQQYNFPSWVFDPNSQKQRSVRANLSTQLNDALTINTNSAYMHTGQATPAGTYFTYGISSGGGALTDSAYGYGYSADKSSSPLVHMGSLQEEATTRGTLATTADWRPTSWLSVHGATGLDNGSQTTTGTVLPQALRFRGYENSGTIAVTNTSTNIWSSDLRASVSLPVTASLRSMTSLGVQVAKTSTKSITASSSEVSEANTSLNGVPNVRVKQNDNGHATLGGYVEQQLGFQDRLFLIAALRLDGASGFGGDYHATTYPKVSASWLAWNNEATTVRLRTAYGTAGVQPQNGSSLQLYYSSTGYDNGTEVSVFQPATPGNPLLKPERSREWEGGLDIGLLRNRINLEFTHYTKHTNDAIVSTSLGWSFNNASWQINLGDIRNSGTEITAQATLVETQSVQWSTTINLSANRNKLLRLAPGVEANLYNDAQRHEVGYPLYGFWGKKVTYADADGNGFLTSDEVTLSDSAYYLGSSIPHHTTSFSTQLSLFRGALTIGSLFDYRAGGKVNTSRMMNLSAQTGTLRAQHDSATPLAAQARIQAALKAYSAPTTLTLDDGTFTRWRELSITANMPQKLLRGPFSSFSVTMAVRNLGLWTPYNGDPEASNAGGNQNEYNYSTGTYVANNDFRSDQGGAVPLPRVWLLRFNMGF